MRWNNLLNNKGRLMSGAERYGQRYWCIKSALSESGEIYVHADEVRILPHGELVAVTVGIWNYGAEIEHVVKEGEPERINLALAPGSWTAVFAASCMDGHAVAVEHWDCEAIRTQPSRGKHRP